MSTDGNQQLSTAADTDSSEKFEQWFQLAELDRSFQGDTPPLPICREFLKTAHQELARQFQCGTDIEELIRACGWLIDQVLNRCWDRMLAGFNGALVAVGGYGRNELLPGSDIDIMLLLAEAEDQSTKEKIEAFLMLLWDIGLEVGHSVRTLDDCHEQAEADITVATNLMEARLIIGSDDLFQSMRKRVGPDLPDCARRAVRSASDR